MFKCRGLKTFFLFYSGKKLLRSTDMKQNVESWACYWQTCKASGLSQLKRVSESTSIFIDLKCSEDWLVTRSFIFNSHDRWPQRFEKHAILLSLVYCLCLSILITSLSWKSRLKFSYRKTCDTVRFFKKMLNIVAHDAFSFIRNFKNSDLSPTLGKISVRFKMFPFDVYRLKRILKD